MNWHSENLTHSLSYCSCLVISIISLDCTIDSRRLHCTTVYHHNRLYNPGHSLVSQSVDISKSLTLHKDPSPLLHHHHDGLEEDPLTDSVRTQQRPTICLLRRNFWYFKSKLLLVTASIISDVHQLKRVWHCPGHQHHDLPGGAHSSSAVTSRCQERASPSLSPLCHLSPG